MDGVGIADRSRAQNSLGIEVTFAGGWRPNTHGFVRKAHVHGIGVGRRMDGNRADTHLAAGAVDAQRNFSAVGDKDFVEHESIR